MHEHYKNYLTQQETLTLLKKSYLKFINKL